MTNPKALTAATLALLFLAACGSTGMGDILGGGDRTDPNYEIRGRVDYVDTANRTVTLTNVSGYNSSMLSSDGGSTVRVHFDDNTPVTYNGQNFRPQDLERGDEVLVRVAEAGTTLVAESMTVTYNVSSGNSDNGTWNDSNSASTIRGTVRYVDTSRRTIELESTSWRSNFDTRTGSGTSGGRVIISYDSNTNVDVSGRSYPVSGLERGDVIDVQVQNRNATNPFAQRIILVRDATQ